MTALDWLSARMRRKRLGAEREEGAAAVEFAIVGILLFTLVFGMIMFAMWLSEYQAMTSAAREGARVAAVHQDYNGDGVYNNNDVVAAVQNGAAAFASDLPAGITAVPADCQASPGVPVTVQWNQHFDVPQLLPFLPHLPGTGAGETKPIKGVFRCE